MVNEEEKKLFVINSEKPMKFTVIKGKMLNIKYNQLLTKIKKNGGIIVDYNEKDEECIMLAHRSHLCTDVNIFNIKFIKDCISQNEVLNLQDYRIIKSHDVFNKNSMALTHIGECTWAKKILVDQKCLHISNRSAEEDLQMIKKL